MIRYFENMDEFKSKLNHKKFEEQGSVSAVCPSNIALIKYWGKREIQIPMNPSLSFTLNKSRTETELKFKPNPTNDFSLKVFFEGNHQPDFEPKIYSFFKRIEDFVPFLKDFEFEIHTSNTFPHSSGIASSASGMGALALCLTEIENLLGADLNADQKLKKASFLARLGSGSACRSVYPGVTVWGKTDSVSGSSDLYAIPYPYKIHPIFKNFRDTVVLIEEGQKSVSSTAGHDLMNDHPYAEKRFESAEENLKKLIPVLKNGDLETFGTIVEHEALSLHAMMMTSHPYYILMKPDTMKLIENIWTFRKQTSVPVFFTLDAGANVHVLFPENQSDEVSRFLKEKAGNHKMIEDFTD
ncbi:MAG: diphosphomevalonate decarboxylase [Moheibacter sp.]